MVLGRVNFFDAIGIAPVWVKVRFQVRDAIDLDQVLEVPEEQAEDWEGADVDAASGDGGENSPDESGQN